MYDEDEILAWRREPISSLDNLHSLNQPHLQPISHTHTHTHSHTRGALTECVQNVLFVWNLLEFFPGVLDFKIIAWPKHVRKEAMNE